MDPVTAIGLASSLITFVDFASKIVAGTYEVYNSITGTTVENARVEDVLQHLQNTTQDLQTDMLGNTKHEKALKQLAVNCEKVMTELSAILSRLQLEGKHSTWRSLKVSINSMHKHKEIAKLDEQLDKYRSQILVQLSMMLIEQNSSVKLQLDRMESAARTLSSESASRTKTLHEKIVRNIDELLNKWSPQDAVAGIDDRLEEIITSLNDLSFAMTTVPKENIILEHLFFSTMDARETSIDSAEEGTFKWIIEEKENLQQKDSGSTGVDDQEFERQAETRSLFLNWLKSGKGVFHISGNPGSGKSTLMKFICNHSRTKEELQKWADEKDKKLVFAQFYFWKSGNDKLQMSLEGLYRSILFATLRQCPELIPTIFPTQWEQLTYGALVLPGHFIRYPDLERAFQLLTTTGHFPKHRFCYFVDGLDEYEGDSWKLKQLAKGIQKWTSFDDVKVCASARPLLELDSLALPPNQEIRLHELTSHDIYLFARQMIEKDENFEIIQDSYLPLVKQVVIKSEGVFMWAYLAVGSLLTLLLRHESIEELERKLNSIPAKMNELYEQLMNSMDSDDREKVIKMLLLTAYNPSGRPLNCVAYSWIDKLSDPEFPPCHGIRPSSWPSAVVLTNNIRLQIKGLTRGLLHTTTMPNSFWDSSYRSQSKKYDPQLRQLRIVQFFHRTVRDFVVEKLEHAEKYESFRSLLSVENYHRLLLAELMTFDSWYQRLYWYRAENGSNYDFWDLESRTSSFHDPLSFRTLDGFKSLIDNINSRSSKVDSRSVFNGFETSYNRIRGLHPVSFAHWAACVGQSDWVMRELKRYPQLLHVNADLSILASAALGRRIELSKDLIKYGCSPVEPIRVAEQNDVNYEDRGHTQIPIWMAVINEFVSSALFHDRKLSEKTFGIIEVLLSDSRVVAQNCVFILSTNPTQQGTQFITLKQIIEESKPSNMETLLSLLQRHKGGLLMNTAKLIISHFIPGQKPLVDNLEAKVAKLKPHHSTWRDRMTVTDICCGEFEGHRVGIRWF